MAAFVLAPQASGGTSEPFSRRNGKRVAVRMLFHTGLFRRASHHDAFFSTVLPGIMTISLTVLQIIGRLKIDEMMR